MSFRRLLLLALLIAAGAATFKRMRDKRSAQIAAPPEWPPFEPTIVPDIEPAPADQPDAFVPGTDAPGSAGDRWVAPGAAGAAPEGFPVKVKVGSGIYHVPGGRFYERTMADRCYPSGAAAEADGYRPSKS